MTHTKYYVKSTYFSDEKTFDEYSDAVTEFSKLAEFERLRRAALPDCKKHTVMLSDSDGYDIMSLDVDSDSISIYF